MRRSLLATALSILAAFAVAVPAQAAQTTIVNVYHCFNFEDGVMTVPPRSSLIIHYGWGTRTRKQALKFKNNVATSFTIDGESIGNTASYWGSPHRANPSDDWTLEWRYPHAKLGRGHLIHVTLEQTLKRDVSDGYTTWAKGSLGEMECTSKAG
jgi:hypothetical protein